MSLVMYKVHWYPHKKKEHYPCKLRRHDHESMSMIGIVAAIVSLFEERGHFQLKLPQYWKVPVS